MRILYHHRTLGDGAEGIHIAEMVNAFRQLGHEVLVIGPGVENVNGEEKRTERYTWVKKLFKGPLYELAELAYNFVGFRNLCRAIHEFQPDFIYDRYITFNYSAIAAGKKYNLPVFLEVNAPLAYEREHEPDEKLCLKKIAYFIEKKVCTEAFKTIVVSTPLKEYLSKKGIPEKNIFVLPNGVNTNKFFPREKPIELAQKYNICKNEIIVGFVGILRPWHGIDLLLKSIKEVQEKFPEVKLMLVGDGPIRDNILQLAEELSLQDCVTVTGRIAYKDVGSYVALFDVAVSPKTTFYASPMKIVEYMAQKKAVVAPATTNIFDLVDHEENGYCFQDDSVRDLAGAIKKILSNKELRTSLGLSAYNKVKKELNWKVNAQKIVCIYEAAKTI